MKSIMQIECPHCHFEFKSEDIAHTLHGGNFKCPVCGNKIPSAPAAKNRFAQILGGKTLVIILMAIGILAALIFYHFTKPPRQATPKPVSAAPAAAESPAALPPVQVFTPPDAPPPPEAMPPLPIQQASPKPDKMKIVEQIAAEFHKGHTYTLEGEFVCLDMAIDVWNQLVTNGIEAKIMGGTLQESITAWNFRQLAIGSNHAWVVAIVGPKEKVAIETTSGTVIKPGMKEYASYFKGIEFDSPAQVKRFELLRKKMNDVCREAHQMIQDWNQNVAGKQLHPAEIVARQSRLEQRKQDCENTFRELREFESKAIFY